MEENQGIAPLGSAELGMGPSVAQTIFRNTVWMTAGGLAVKGLNFLFNIYVVRQLGDGRYGQYTTVLAFAGLFAILAELGMSAYVSREIAQDRSKTQMWLGNLMALRLILAALCVALITGAAVLAGYEPDLVRGVFIYSCTFLLAAISAPLYTVLAGYERLDYNTVISIIGRVIFMVVGAAFLLSGKNYIWLIVASLVEMPVEIILMVLLIRRQRIVSLVPHINPRLWLPLIKAGLPFGIISLMLRIAFSIDTVMLSMFWPDNMVGWYNVSYGLVRSLLFFFSGFSFAIIPSLSRAYVNDPQAVNRWYYHSVRVIAFISVPATVGAMLVAGPLVSFLYGAEFAPSVPILQAIIWDLPLLMFCSFCGNMTTIVGLERAAARVFGINALANVVLNALLIPEYGAMGAAVVTVVTDLVGAIQFYVLLRHKLSLPDISPLLLRVLAATAIMGGIVALAHSLPLFVVITLGGVVYLALAVAFKIIGEPERALAMRIWRRVASRRMAPAEEE